MKGYLNNESATKNTIDDDGWLHTGDIGHIDADGHLFIVDRLKELIKYKGFQVPPAELEALLLTHPQIADAAVIGVPDDEAGEIPAAYVVLKPGQDATAADIQGFVAEKVANYKQVRKLTFVDAIPKSASGKILRRAARPSRAIGPPARCRHVVLRAAAASHQARTAGAGTAGMGSAVRRDAPGDPAVNGIVARSDDVWLRRFPRVGVRFADGRPGRRSPHPFTDAEKDEDGMPTRPIIRMTGGGGGGNGFRRGLWVFPLPPPGPVEIFVSAPQVGGDESRVIVEGADVLAAAERAEVIWDGRRWTVCC